MTISMGIDYAITDYGGVQPRKAVAASGSLVEYASSRVKNPLIQLIYSVSVS